MGECDLLLYGAQKTELVEMGLRELKKTRTRQGIRRAAMRLFGDQGYEATTVEQIAADAEASTATFYRYYCDKEDVVVNPGDIGDLIR